MKSKMSTTTILILILMFSGEGCGKKDAQQQPGASTTPASSQQSNASDTTTPATAPKVTFVELGSVNCLPGKIMQPVMEAIEEAFGFGHCSVIVLAGTLTERVQQYLNWTEKTRSAIILRRICGVLVIIGGIYLIFK